MIEKDNKGKKKTKGEVGKPKNSKLTRAKSVVTNFIHRIMVIYLEV